MKNKLTTEEYKEVEQWAFEGGDCPYWLEAWACDHWAGDIPYGTLTGDTGTVDEWLSDRIESVIDYWEIIDPNEPELSDADKTNGV